MKNYTQYRVEDFVLDDYFRDWVLTKSTRCETFWQEWIKNHPEKRPVIDEAREILLALQPDQPQINPGEVEEDFRKISLIYNRIIGRHKKFRYRRLLLLAAISLILFFTVWYLCQLTLPREPTKTYYTKAGQQKSIHLPDGSVVFLNEESRLSYASNWKGSEERKVKLRGEALFQVTEELNQKVRIRFLVTTRDLSIEVLGTEFMIRQRNTQTKVILESGKIMLRILGGKKHMIMVAGDVALYDAATQKLTSQRKQTPTRKNDSLFTPSETGPQNR